MNTTHSPRRLLALAGLSLCTFTLLAGCSDTKSDATPADAADHDHASDDNDHGHDHADTAETTDTTQASTADVYKGILGEITMLPVEGDPSTNFRIHHMQIPNFKLKDGTINIAANGIAGMKSMTMPFPLEEGVSIEGFNVGDKVSFDFAVDWSGQSGTAWAITHIEKIDASTEIDYTNQTEDMSDSVRDAIDSAMDSAVDDMNTQPDLDAP